MKWNTFSACAPAKRCDAMRYRGNRLGKFVLFPAHPFIARVRVEKPSNQKSVIFLVVLFTVLLPRFSNLISLCARRNRIIGSEKVANKKIVQTIVGEIPRIRETCAFVAGFWCGCRKHRNIALKDISRSFVSQCKQKRREKKKKKFRTKERNWQKNKFIEWYF